MALSPLSAVDVDLSEDLDVVTETDVEPSRTYALDLDSGAVGGIIDGREAIRQFILKAILTSRFHFSIYDEDYGCELEDLIGQDVPMELLETEIPRVITEALIYDDRIDDVYGFDITKEADNLFVSFYVDVDGEEMPMEVTV
ncbi:phage baseplate assembly protein W [Paenibacillus sp. RC73]